LRADCETREIAIGGELLTDLITELQAVFKRTQQNLSRTHRTTAEEDQRRSHALMVVMVSGVFIANFVAARDGFEAERFRKGHQRRMGSFLLALRVPNDKVVDRFVECVARGWQTAQEATPLPFAKGVVFYGFAVCAAIRIVLEHGKIERFPLLYP